MKKNPSKLQVTLDFIEQKPKQKLPVQTPFSLAVKPKVGLQNINTQKCTLLFSTKLTETTDKSSLFILVVI